MVPGQSAPKTHHCIMKILLLTLSFLSITSASNLTHPSSFINKTLFPILPSYLELENGVFKWLPIIYKTIILYIHFYARYKDLENRERAFALMDTDNFLHSLWQVFVPGSWVENLALTDEGADKNQGIKIIKVLVSPWVPLQHDQVILIYSAMICGKLETKEWKYKKPASTINSTLMTFANEGRWSTFKDVVLIVLHYLQDIKMNPNYGLINTITRGISIQSKNGKLGPIPRPGFQNPDLIPTFDSLGTFEFPGTFPVAKVEKLIKAGFIPLLPTYYYNKSLMSADLYMLLVKGIIAVVIQKYIPITYRDDPLEEAKIMAAALMHHLQLFFPGCSVEKWSTTHQYDVFSQDKNDPNISLIVIYSAPQLPSFLTLRLVLDEYQQTPMTINRFLKLRPLLYPNTAFLHNRRFSGISTSIYNNITFSQTNPIDFKPIIHQYLTTYAMLHTFGLPIKNIVHMLPEYKSLVLESDTFVLEEGTKLLVLPGVPYNVSTIIAYSRNLLFSIHVPFVLFELIGKEKVKLEIPHGKSFKLITARHLDEPKMNANWITSKPITAQ